MTLIEYLGGVGSGKTLMETIEACLADANDIPIYANYEIKLKNWNRLKPEMLQDIEGPCLIFVDEAYAWLESRRSGMPINMFMSYILFQHRKRKLEIRLSDQIDGVIDTRYRQMTDFHVFCNASQEGFEYDIFNKTSFIGSMVLPMQVAELFFPMYDTFELINPIDDELLFKISTDKKGTVVTVDQIANEILSKIKKGARITKGVVADYCLRNEYPRYLVSMVYDALTAKKSFA